MKCKLTFSILISFFMITLFSINVSANDVFSNDSFTRHGYYANKIANGIGDSKFIEHYVNPGYKNTVAVNSTGKEKINGKYENYVDFSYGSEGDYDTKEGNENRYVNFQMEFNDSLRFNDSHKTIEHMIDGSHTTISYNTGNKNQKINLSQMSVNVINENNKIRKIYNHNFNCNYYHSGQITVRLYLKSNIKYENAYKHRNTPLINLYYKSGSYESESTPKYYIFEIAQTLRFKAIKNKVRDEVNDNADKLKNYVNTLFENSPTDINTLNAQINNRREENQKKLNKINRLNKLIYTKEDINDNFAKSIHLLRLKSIPHKFIFNNASTKDSSSNLSQSTLDTDSFAVSSFNEPSWNITMKMSNLINKNGQGLKNTSFQLNNSSTLIYPDTIFNYCKNINSKNGYGRYGLYPIKLNYSKGVMPSGTYAGTATWDISPKVNDNGIKIK